ncbi:cytochrome b/b6 domain-containing protein [Streptomyces sp. NPDC048384]|uniref:cytochrome b n=1 Tax=Streptomyces sp. NPDC048384 TaxID=3155487 RepID=UPI00344A91A3
MLTVHVVLGATVLLIAAARLAWRLATPLPTWAPTLTARERRLAHGTETTLYVTTFAVPVTGLVLLLSGDDDLLGVHVAAQIVLYAALAVHVGLVLKHQLINRDRLLGRML